MSTEAIGSLRVNLGIDSAEFAAGLSRAQGSLATFGKNLKAFAITAAGALSLGAIGGAVQSVVNHMDELGKAAQKIGIPVEELSKLEYAGKLADVTLEDLTATLAKFSKNIAEVAAGGQNDAGKALAAIGVSATDAQGKLLPTTQIISDIAEEFSVMRDGANKTALAIALFGKSGAEMIPLLNGGRDAIASAGAELQKFGGVVTPEASKRAEDFNDNITRLQTAFGSLLQEVITPILPKLIDLTQSFIDLAKTGAPVEEWVNNTISFFEELKPFIETTRKEIDLLTEGLRYLGLVDKKPLEIDIYGGDLPVDKKPPKPKTKPLRDAPALRGSSTSSAKPGSADDIYGAGFSKQLEETTRTFQDLWDEMDSGIPTTNAAADAFQSMADTISNSLSTALEGLITGTMSVKDAFKSMAQSISQTLAQIAADLIKSSLLKILSIVASSAMGGGGVHIGGAYFGGAAGFRAAGGPVSAGKGYIVGEEGPEWFQPGSSGHIVPNDKLGGGSSVNVKIINNSSAHVSARQNTQGDLEVMVEEIMADKAIRGGNKFDAAMQRGYGLRRAGR